MNCPKCNKPIGRDHPYSWCSECGEPLPDDIYAQLQIYRKPNPRNDEIEGENDKKIFQIYTHENLGIEIIKLGWCWPAFLFNGLWAIYMQLWIPFCVSIGLSIFLGLMFGHASTIQEIVLIYAIGLTSNIIFGTQGNSWHRERLQRAGYKFSASIGASDESSARRKYEESDSDRLQTVSAHVSTNQSSASSEQNWDVISKLEKLGQLKERGILTEDEFKILKGRLLGPLD